MASRLFDEAGRNEDKDAAAVIATDVPSSPEALGLAICRARSPTMAYCRTSSPQRSELEDVFKQAYGFARGDSGTTCCVLPSGMAAIGAVMYATALKYPRGLFVLGNELYCDVARSARYLQRAFAELRVAFVDVRDGDAVLNVFRREQANVALLHVESCTNPSGQMFDWALVTTLRRWSPKCVVCVDNTWLTSALFNPFACARADIVLESLSKYNSAGRCIGGVALGRRRLLSGVAEWVRVNGQFVAADHCALFCSEAATLAERVRRASAVAMRVATHLAATRGVTALYPLLATHPTHAVYTAYVSREFGPACIWFHVRSDCSLDDLREAMATCALRVETSFGSAHTKLDPFPRLGLSDEYFCAGRGERDGHSGGGSGDAADETTQQQQHMQQQGAGDQGAWMRLAVGHDDTTEGVCAALDALIERLQSM